MAYMDYRDTVCLTAPAPLAAAVEAHFDRREWNVIALARWDGLASLRPPTRLARLLQRLFGGNVDKRLADPRLEALRRFAVLAWHHGYTLPVSAMKAFKEAGWSVDHLELLLASVSIDRNRRHRVAAA